MVSVRDITLRDMHTKITVLRTTNQEETTNKLQNLIHGGIAEILKISNAKVGVLPIAGIDLNRDNHRTGTLELKSRCMSLGRRRCTSVKVGGGGRSSLMNPKPKIKTN